MTAVPAIPAINADRLWQRIMALAELTEPDRPWTRRSFTPMFLQGRAWLQEAFAAAGLEPHIDACGNLIGRRAGCDASSAPIMLGSHCDTVPAGGRFDGIAGVMCALEVAQSLQEAGVTLRQPLEVVDFLAEEPSAFGPSCIGSRALAGALGDDMLAMTRADGMTLAEGIAYAGGDPAQLAAAARGPGSVAAYLEVHIEQARLLETTGTPIGVVTGIAAIRRQRIVIRGQTDHAGATPMALRRDALVAAAELVSGVATQAGSAHSKAEPLVATVGQLDVTPNASNAVPGAVTLVVEARSPVAAKMDTFIDATLTRLLATIAARGFAIEREDISHADGAPCDSAIIAAIEAAAAQLAVPTLRLPSGAGHDAMFISRMGPMGMIFLPCRDGRSHAPEEWAEPQDCATAARVMLASVLDLAAPLAG